MSLNVFLDKINEVGLINLEEEELGFWITIQK